MSDRVMVMYHGEVVESAVVDEFYGRPQHPYSRVLLEFPSEQEAPLSVTWHSSPKPKMSQ